MNINKYSNCSVIGSTAHYIVKNTKARQNKGMKSVDLPSEAEIRETAGQDEDAVVALVFSAFGKLVERIEQLEDRVTKNSSNSGKPPNPAMDWRRTPKACGTRAARKAEDSRVILEVR